MCEVAVSLLRQLAKIEPLRIFEAAPRTAGAGTEQRPDAEQSVGVHALTRDTCQIWCRVGLETDRRRIRCQVGVKVVADRFYRHWCMLRWLYSLIGWQAVLRDDHRGDSDTSDRAAVGTPGRLGRHAHR